MDVEVAVAVGSGVPVAMGADKGAQAARTMDRAIAVSKVLVFMVG